MNEPLTIASGGVSPSNQGAGFPDLARGFEPSLAAVNEVTDIAAAELRAADIEVTCWTHPQVGQVPSCAVGSLCQWVFQRAWYYWIAKGPGIPVEVAERLHATHGQQVRVAGHCGCPSPRDWFKGFGVGHYHVDSPAGLKALADTIRSVASGAVALVLVLLLSGCGHHLSVRVDQEQRCIVEKDGVEVGSMDRPGVVVNWPKGLR